MVVTLADRSAPITILIVDDEQELTTTLARILEAAGHQTVIAESYDAAQRVLEAAVPDVLLVDVRLNDHNGLQIIAMAPMSVAAVVMTGHDDPVIRREAHRLGAAFLVKPIESELLLSTIDAQLAAIAPRTAGKRTQ